MNTNKRRKKRVVILSPSQLCAAPQLLFIGIWGILLYTVANSVHSVSLSFVKRKQESRFEEKKKKLNFISSYSNDGQGLKNSLDFITIV